MNNLLVDKISELRVLFKLLNIDIPLNTERELIDFLNVWQVGELCLDGRIEDENYNLVCEKLSELHFFFAHK